MTELTAVSDAPIETWPVVGHDPYHSLKERLAALMDEQVVVERCTSCPDFIAEGPFREARALFRTHVELVHPERLVALNKRRMPRRITPSREPDYVVLDRLAQIAGVAA